MRGYTRTQKWKSSLQSWSQSIPIKLLHHAASSAHILLIFFLVVHGNIPHRDNKYRLSSEDNCIILMVQYDI